MPISLFISVIAFLGQSSAQPPQLWHNVEKTKTLLLKTAIAL